MTKMEVKEREAVYIEFFYRVIAIVPCQIADFLGNLQSRKTQSRHDFSLLVTLHRNSPRYNVARFFFFFS